jgi:hypothetical protein
MDLNIFGIFIIFQFKVYLSFFIFFLKIFYFLNSPNQQVDQAQCEDVAGHLAEDVVHREPVSRKHPAN